MPDLVIELQHWKRKEVLCARKGGGTPEIVL